MSERTLRDAEPFGLTEDDLFDDEVLGTALVRGGLVPAAPMPDGPPPPDEVDDEEYDVVPREAPRPAGVDALAEEPAPRRPVGRRERIRSSRFGTLVVLLLTAALVGTGVWLVNGGPSGRTSASGTTSVSLPGTSKAPAPRVGTPAQDFTLTTVDGRKVSLSDYRGKAVWVVFGASWCAACQAEAPDVEAAYEKYAARGVVVLGVNISEDQAAVRAYAQRIGITYPVGSDEGSVVADAYRVSAIPAHFFVDRAGVLREQRQGSVSPEAADAVLTRLVAP